MSEKTKTFGDKKINKKDFYNNKKQFHIEDIDINKILISKPETYENNMRKYITGHNTIGPLQLFLSKMTGYLNIFENRNRKMSFFTNNNEFLERYTVIWEKISDLVNKKFDSDPIYKCISLISLDSIIKNNKKYYPQTLLQECVYKILLLILILIQVANRAMN